MNYFDQPTELEILDDRLTLLHDLSYLFYSQHNCSCGGALHILLDDFNIRDSDIAFCQKEIEKEKWVYIKELGIAILDMMKTLSPAQRLYWTQHRSSKDILSVAGKDIKPVKNEYGDNDEADMESSWKGWENNE